MSGQKLKVPVQFEFSPEDLNTLSEDLKTIYAGLDKACQNGCFTLKDSSSLQNSMENINKHFIIVNTLVQQRLKDAESKVEKNQKGKKKDGEE